MKRLLALALSLLLCVGSTPIDAAFLGYSGGITLASGSVSNANMTVTLTAGSADIDFSSATVPRNYRGAKLTVCDSAPKCIVGYVGTDGAGTVQNVVSTKGGSTRNWAAQTAGFNADDDSGYTYLVERVPGAALVASGVLTSSNVRLATVATGALLEINGTDLSTYASTANYSYLIALYSALGAMLAYTGAVGGGEALGGELLADPTFDTPAAWSVDTGVTISGGKGNWAAATGSARSVATPTHGAGQLLKAVSTSDSYTSGSQSFYFFGSSSASVSAGGTQTVYRTDPAINNIFGLQGTGLTATFTDISLQRVTNVAATGLALRNAAKLGGAQSIIGTVGTFDPNAVTSYKVYMVGP